MERILIVDDEPSLRVTLGDALEDAGYEVELAATLAEARSLLAADTPDLVLCDLRLPDGTGLDLLREIKAAAPELPVVMLTAYGTIQGAVEAMRAGADEYLTKPFEEGQVLAVVARHLEVVRLRRRVAELESGGDRPLGRAPAWLRALELAETVARADTTVLLLGETGTGKEVVARFIHRRSRRRNRPFVAVNCAALPETLLEAELFGHERGAFTGAVRARAGRFEAADGGTLFLDEVAEMSPEVQAKLLRVLEERRVTRLGSNRAVEVDVRLVAATRRDLEAEVAEGRFRDDLYYRLKVVPIELPPLRERPGDILLLAQHFVRRYAAEAGRELQLSPEVLRCLEHHPFPGNVRELENLIHRLAVTCPADVVRVEHLPEEYARRCGVTASVGELRLDGTLAEILHEVERRVLTETLERFEGHRGRTAEALGISRKNLWEKLKAHGIEGPKE